MSLPTAQTTLMVLLSMLVPGQAQGTFGNLDFESATVPLLAPGQGGALVSPTDGMPDWTAYYDGSPVGAIFHNTVSIGGAAIAIEGPQYDPNSILQGQYTAYLVGDLIPGSGDPGRNWTALGQSGQIPAGAVSLRFLISPTSTFQVTFGGVSLPATYLGGTSKFSVMEADISQFAGQTGELRFTALPGQGGYLDFVNFSNVPVPEPSSCAVAVLGAVLLGVVRRLRSPKL